MEVNSTERKLNIVSFNAQGLRNVKKLRALFREFKKKNFDIITIQETYLLKEDIPLIEREWEGPFFLSEGTKNSKGLLTLFRKSFKEEDIICTFSNDRIIMTSFNFDDNPLIIFNIYGPCGDKDKPIFLNDLSKLIDLKVNKEEAYYIIMGDINIVKSNNLDIIAGSAHTKRSVSELNKFVDNYNLIDVWRTQNPNTKEYTWGKNNNQKSTFTARRLDYIFTNQNIFPFCQDADIHSLGFSDHRAVSLSFNFSAFQRGPNIFKLNTDLLKDIDFVNIIKREINLIKDMTELNPHLKWEFIKIKIKSTAKSYGMQKALEKKKEKSMLITDLTGLESLLSKNPNDNSLVTQVNRLKKKLEIFLLKETEGARIRAGIKYQEQGEKCNNFFLSLERQRSRNDTIFRMNNHANLTLKENDEILNFLTVHYEELYKNPPPKPHQESQDEVFCQADPDFSLSDEEAAPLECEITEAELHRSVASMKNGSSPGMDGIPAEVYKVLWIDVKEALLNSINFSFEVESLSQSQTHGIIKLLHKGKGVDRLLISGWRPISLLNADYKIIAKLIARRLNTVLHKLIDPNQYAFIKGRNAGDMIRELDDIIELEKIKRETSILLSIDYAKAFDTLSTKAINKAMKIYGFKDNFLKWINILLLERKSCIKNNNHISRFFQMERGVRQGCPLSPLLFICTVELLARNIRKDDNIKGITANGRNRPVKIRQFADDTTLFLKDQMDFREVLSKIKHFAIFSGLELNKDKSMAMILGGKKSNEKNICGIKVVNKVKILGVYLSNIQQPCDIEEN